MSLSVTNKYNLYLKKNYLRKKILKKLKSYRYFNKL